MVRGYRNGYQSQGWDSNPRNLDYKSSTCTAQAPLARVSLGCPGLCAYRFVALGQYLPLIAGGQVVGGRFEFDPVGTIATTRVKPTGGVVVSHRFERDRFDTAFGECRFGGV
jgi:hypothetical protein